MRKLASISLILLLASGCNMIEEFGGQPEMTSPCVGAEDSPCGPKRPVNQWLQKFNNEQSFA